MGALYENGAQTRLHATVAALQRRGAFPEETAVRIIETHMAVVFLTEALAYKLKKPLRTEHFDYTSIRARRQACEAELELNRRLAPDVYLAVVPVVSKEGLLRVGLPGPPIDWLIKMRRLPEDRMLDVCIGRHTVKPEDMASVARVLTQFYSHAERVPCTGPAYRARLKAQIATKRDSLLRPRYGLSEPDIHDVVHEQQHWLYRHETLLAERAAHLVDAHGDLRPEHVCLELPRPVVIDCLEFSRNLRVLDPVSELSFLALECSRLGAPWIGERILEGYSKASGDIVPETLVQFYQSTHALVRAAIAVWHLDDDALDHSDRWRERGTWYLQAARTILSETVLSASSRSDP
jgi:uncharacterized protein